MGKCVRIRSSSEQPPPAACLTLRSGRRVLPVAAPSVYCGPRTSRPPPPRHRGSSRRCGTEGAFGSSPRRRSAADATRSPRGQVQLDGAQHRLRGGRPEEQLPPPPPSQPSPAARDDVDGCGSSSFESETMPPMADDCDCDVAAMVKAQAKHEDESRKGVVAATAGRPPPKAEMEAFFAAAELAERRRFAEAYNYDVALDRPLEGRFEWAPMST